MKELPLSCGRKALISDEDWCSLSRFKWSLHRASKGRLYACRRVGGSGNEKILMHQAILGAVPGMEIDHRNGCTLDNRRENLRLATHSQNMMNAKKPANRTTYTGVGAHGKRYGAYISANGRRRRLGCFDTPEEAAVAYNDAAVILHGEFARLNKLKESEVGYPIRSRRN